MQQDLMRDMMLDDSVDVQQAEVIKGLRCGSCKRIMSECDCQDLPHRIESGELQIGQILRSNKL